MRTQLCEVTFIFPTSPPQSPFLIRNVLDATSVQFSHSYQIDDTLIRLNSRDSEENCIETNIYQIKGIQQRRRNQQKNHQ